MNLAHPARPERRERRRPDRLALLWRQVPPADLAKMVPGRKPAKKATGGWEAFNATLAMHTARKEARQGGPIPPVEYREEQVLELAQQLHKEFDRQTPDEDGTVELVYGRVCASMVSTHGEEEGMAIAHTALAQLGAAGVLVKASQDGRKFRLHAK